jgi:hypothetical protein
MKAYITKNLWGYEQLNPAPQLLDDSFFKFYITDDVNSKEHLLNNGWDDIIVIENYKHITNLKERRRIISEINCFPGKYIENLNNFEKVFNVDSNVISLWNDFLTFTNSCPDDKCLYITSGWYDGARNSIIAELRESNQSRWSYDYESMKLSVDNYKNEIENLGIDFYSIPVISAKYFGWNINHPEYETISNHFYKEYTKHLQGNIILSYLSSIYKNDIFEYRISNYIGGEISSHKFLG